MENDYSNLSRDEIVERITRRRVSIDVNSYFRIVRNQIDDAMTAKEFLDVAPEVFRPVILYGLDRISEGV